MTPPCTVAPARPEDLAPAFALFFRHLQPAERDRRVTTALGLVAAGELDPAGVLVAWIDGAPCGVFVCQLAPGAAAVVWPPQVSHTAAQTAVEDALVGRACAWLRQRAKLAHALLTEQEYAHADPLLRNGFRHITGLWYLRHDLADLPAISPRLQCRTSDTDPALFAQTLLRTYEGTRDCPEINYVREIEEVLDGHRAQGRHDPRYWWLALDAERPVGVLLLADVPALGGWDLSYLGVVPEARRRGVGRELTCRALAEACRAGVPRLSLAVDTRNEPAWALYRGLGFTPYDRREVLLVVWGSPR